MSETVEDSFVITTERKSCIVCRLTLPLVMLVTLSDLIRSLRLSVYAVSHSLSMMPKLLVYRLDACLTFEASYFISCHSVTWKIPNA